MSKEQLHKKHCDNCLKFLIGQCGGIKYHVEGIINQPLCDKAKKELKRLEEEQKQC